MNVNLSYLYIRHLTATKKTRIIKHGLIYYVIIDDNEFDTLALTRNKDKTYLVMAYNYTDVTEGFILHLHWINGTIIKQRHIDLLNRQ